MNSTAKLRQQDSDYLRLLLEQKKRRLARKSAVAFTNAIAVPGRPVSEDEDEWLFHPIETAVALHHYMILDVLQKISTGMFVHEGELVRNCMLFMPPGAAKSTCASVVFPSWYMGAFPGKQIILTSYASRIARKHGKKARQICSSVEYASIFNTQIKADTRAADEWALENGSEYMSGGLQSGLTGNRADGLVVDDPISGRQDAESETVRVSTWEAYENDADTRLKPGGWKCVIQTRWHEDDLAGRILPENWSGESGVMRCRDGELWVIVCLQAECERDDDPLGRKIGDGLWPEWFIHGHFDRFKRNPRTWRSLFQQTPTADEGTYFKREWFNFYSDLPKNLNVYITLDSAETQDGGDYTFIVVWGVCPAGRVYVLNIWRDQVETDVWVDVLTGKGGKRGFIKQYKPLFLAPEDDNIFKAVKPFLKRRMRDTQSFCVIKSMPHGSKSKPVRAQSFQGIAGMGLVYLPRDNHLAEILLDQLMKFPSGKYDDGVDACSAFGRLIDKIWEQDPPKPETEEIVIPESPGFVLEDFAPKGKQPWQQT